jgi:uracil-DNA glycosylase
MANKKRYLKEMGIDVWKNKTKTKTNSNAKQSQPYGLETIKQQVSSCTLCDLHKSRTNTVFGVGSDHAQIMFIGEAPGANEDLKGEPFVGRAGMLLNSMLKSIGLNRDDVYIANILKCRPPGNRDPLPEEIKLCTPYLQQQITLIKPKILIAVGRVAAQHLLNSMESMSKLRGNTFYYGEHKTPLLVTYHPAYLLRSPSEKKKAYIDFLLIKKMIIGSKL